MQDVRSYFQPHRVPERLEDRYGKIGIAAVAAALRPVGSRGTQRTSSLPPKFDDPQS